MTRMMSISALEQDDFASRHIGPDSAAIAGMLASMGAASLDQLIDETVPADIRLPRHALAQALPAAMSEHAALARLQQLASQNQLKKSLIGLGYHGTRLPAVIQRNVLENPGWYTAYTPYQAEISQGRLEALLNFQHMVMDLTGLPLANASLLDEATAAAEAMAMARRISRVKSEAFFVDESCLPQTLDVLRTRAHYFGFELVVGRPEDATRQAVFGALFQYPSGHGEVRDLTPCIAAVKAAGGITVVAADILALVLLKSPGAMGADIALGSSQRFGIPMGAGGPHAAYFATRDEHKRQVPGRIIGVSVDARGKPALRMALQTREQHIRREKANSNICTSQVLLANLAGFYAVYHGPQGLRRIAWRVQRLTSLLASGLQAAGVALVNASWFDTLHCELGGRATELLQAACAAGYNLRRVSETRLGISLDELTTAADVACLIRLLAGQVVDVAALDEQLLALDEVGGLAQELLRMDAILSHPVFNSHHSEHAMLRYLKRLQNKDLAMDHAMIPLGSCTMKLNATSEMLPISWPQLAAVHPFAPPEQLAGTRAIVDELAEALRIITGFDAVSMQPNSGAQGEYAGLVTIRRYQASRGEGQRDVCLIPRSAHGTNPATAQMCGLEVVVVSCDDNGNVDIDDLRAKAVAHAARLSCIMLTYPSTHGVFEEGVREICAIVHEQGGQVYMDGANLNAQVGLTSPGLIGADVSHINLHKTFAIPHGGGGPGMGPIGLKAHLAPFMPGHVLQPQAQSQQAAVSAAPWGSALILPISWMYIRMLGGAGLTRATEVAILNANYVANRLKEHYPVLYTGAQGRVAHECILDVRAIKAACGISELDIAKRLMDYGFHAPTVSFPVAGTLMVEPTESEDRRELDRFIAAMLGIRAEIRQIEQGVWPQDDNPLKYAPHTQADIAAAEWSRPYTREQAVFPLPYVAANKFWPTVNRIDDVQGDRQLICSCPPLEETVAEGGAA